MNSDFVAGLDIGTTKICALLGENVGEDEINIRGVGITSSKGLRKGMVVNLESTVDSIGRAVAEASKKSGCGIVDLCCSGYNPLTVADGWFSLLTGAMGKELQMNEYSPPPISPDSIVRKTVQVVENVKTTLNEYWDIF